MLKVEDSDNPAIDSPVNFKNLLLSNVTPLFSYQWSGVSYQYAGACPPEPMGKR